MRNFLIISMFFLSGIAYSQTLKSLIDSLIFTLPASSEISVYAYDPMTQEPIYRKNINESLTPASNLKLFTMASSLKNFGIDYQFTTALFSTDQDFYDSTLNGDLYIKGFGNSAMTINQVDSLAHELKKLGIYHITGNIIADDSYLDNNYDRSEWIVDENSNVAVPPVSALVIDRNMMILRLRTVGKDKAPLTYEVYPDIKYIDVDMSARITRFRSHPRIVSNFTDDKINISVSGGLKKQRYAKRYAVYPDNPALYTAMVFADRIEKEGIQIDGKPLAATLFADTNTKLLSVSSSIGSLLAKMGKNSDNFTSECMFKSLGAIYSGRQGNSFYATQALMSMINDELAITDSISIVDGSGISRFNKLTTSAIVSLLEYVYMDDQIFETFYNSLTIAGYDGTLKERLIGTEAESKFRGKTGTLNGVSAVSGYLTTVSGNDLIISILMEFSEKGSAVHKDIQNKIIELLAKYY